MERISPAAAAIVAQLIDKVKGLAFLDIKRPGLPTLNVKGLEKVTHPDGEGFLFCIGLFADASRFRYITRVISLVVDLRSAEKPGTVHVFPFYYRDDPNDATQLAAFLSGGTMNLTEKAMQRDICAFMERWVVDLQTDGYV